MPRRAQSKVSIPALVGGIVFFAILAGGGFLVLNRSQAIDHPALSLEELRSNSLQLRDNLYSLEGTVNRRERVTADGQFLSLSVMHNGREEPVPVLIPSSVPSQNIESGYRLRMVVRINAQGIPEAEQIVR